MSPDALPSELTAILRPLAELIAEALDRRQRPAMLTVDAVVREYPGVRRRAVDAAIRTRVLPSTIIGKARFVKRGDVEAWLAGETHTRPVAGPVSPAEIASRALEAARGQR